MTDNEQIQVSKRAYPCGHCANVALMYIICSGTEHHDNPRDDRVQTNIYVFKCPSCHQYNVIGETFLFDQEYLETHTDNDSLMDPYYRGLVYERAKYIREFYLYPISRRIFQNLPKDVSKSYKVAHKLLSIEP